MNLKTFPGGPLSGRTNVPGDKSISHRAALLAALAQGESRIENFLVSGVTQAMLNALTALGVDWILKGTTLTVQGTGLRGLRPPRAPIDCGNSATTLRLLAGVLAAAGIPAVLDGSPGLRRRPMERIVGPLRGMGVPVEASPGGAAPLRFSARPLNRPLRPLDFTLPVASAQVKSCLLLASLGASGETVLCEPGPSRDHTERLLRFLGVPVISQITHPGNGRTDYQTRLTPPDALSPLRLSLPGDFSAAAFLIVAALITPGSEIALPEVGLNPTRTGLLDALRQMGADIQLAGTGQLGGEPAGELIIRQSQLQGTEIGGDLVVRMIDEFPVFAVAASYAQGRTTVRDAGELRHKESDRISSLCAELRKLGADVLETEAGFIVRGVGALLGGRVQPSGDHRLAMSLAVAGLAARKPVEIRDAEIMTESFPGFIETLQSLGARLAVQKTETHTDG